VHDCDVLCPGVFMVMGPESGGILVAKDIAAFLSPAARQYGIRAGGYFCYEENTKEVIVLRELLDKKLWGIPYWINVWWVGIGQGVACYALGMPLWFLLHKSRKVIFER
jgi:hypothetical protein